MMQDFQYMISMEKDLIRTLLFYTVMLDNKNTCTEFQDELSRMGLTWDYYYRAIDKAKHYLEIQND